jgi:hypothetical protein
MQRWAVRIAMFLLIASAGYNAGVLWAWQRGDGASGSTLPRNAEMGDSSVVEPHADLLPREVVELQVEALAKCQTSEHALRQVYALASTDNKEATGPIARFAAMLLSPTFKPLVEQHRAVLGKAVVHGDMAAVTVTVADQNFDCHTYRFYLAREIDDPNRNCWTTYGVSKDNSRAEDSQTDRVVTRI